MICLLKRIFPKFEVQTPLEVDRLKHSGKHTANLVTPNYPEEASKAVLLKKFSWRISLEELLQSLLKPPKSFPWRSRFWKRLSLAESETADDGSFPVLKTEDTIVFADLLDRILHRFPHRFPVGAAAGTWCAAERLQTLQIFRFFFQLLLRRIKNCETLEKFTNSVLIRNF